MNNKFLFWFTLFLALMAGTTNTILVEAKKIYVEWPCANINTDDPEYCYWNPVTGEKGP